MKASDIMAREIVTLPLEATVADAVRLMLEKRVSGIPVTSSTGQIRGMVTEGDFLRRAEIGTEKQHRRWVRFLLDPAVLAQDYANAHTKYVADVMTRDVATVQEDTPIEEVVKTMQDYHVKRVPVERNGMLIGIITRMDIIRALSAKVSGPKTISTSDKAISRILGHVLHDLSWRHQPRFDVRDGIVDLIWIGETFDWERKAARIAAQDVPGVREVHEHFLKR